MNVSFCGNVREYTNGEKSYELPEACGDCLSVRDLAGKLGDHFGERFREFLLGGETCFFLINGKGIMMSGGLDTKIHPGDKIDVLPFIQGG